jgi:hypothetical protein
MDKATWANLVTAFYTEWPKTVVVKASKAERIRVLKEWELKLEELGKKTETLGGKEVWTHVKWADGIRRTPRTQVDFSYRTSSTGYPCQYGTSYVITYPRH